MYRFHQDKFNAIGNSHLVMRRILPLLLAVTLLTYGADKKSPKQKEVEVQKSSIPTEQEIQLGKEAAAEVERQMEVVKNPEIEAWLNRIGSQLAKTPQANAYPYYFRLVNEDSINAFALPGRPEVAVTGGTMFVEKFAGKWAGSEGNKTLSGKITLQLSDGRTLEGTFAVHAVTWG